MSQSAHAHKIRKQYEYSPRDMDSIGNFLDEADFGVGLEECLIRDCRMLKEALANDSRTSDEFSDYLEDGEIEDYGYGLSSYSHLHTSYDPCGATRIVLNRLQECLKQNVFLLDSLQKLLGVINRAIRDNRSKQNKLQQASRWSHPGRKGHSLVSFRVKNCPYFVDHKMEFCELLGSFPDKLVQQREYHLYRSEKSWNASDSRKLKASMR